MKRSPLKRYTPLKSGGRLRNASAKRQRDYNKYGKEKKAYLALHPQCERCKTKKATDIHHKAGRVGDWLCRYEYFAALCRECHDWIHHNGKEARKQGWIIDTFRLPQYRGEEPSLARTHKQDPADSLKDQDGTPLIAGS